MNAQTAKITPGPWIAECIGTGGDNSNPVDVYEVNNGYARVAEHLSEVDANLIAEAGNVYHETGLTPRQLAEDLRDAENLIESYRKDCKKLAVQRVELLSVAYAVFRACEQYLITNTSDEDSIGVLGEFARNAIYHATGEQP